MSLVHLEKSVLSFHLRELLEDGHAGNQLALMGLGAVLFGPRILPIIAKASRPVAKQLIKSRYSYNPQISLKEWVQQSQEQHTQKQHHTEGISAPPGKIYSIKPLDDSEVYPVAS